MKYRNIKSDVDAIQFKRSNWYEVEEFGKGNISQLTIEKRPNGDAFCLVNTSYGLYKAKEGQFIVRDSVGELHLYESNLFKETYEPVNRY